VDVREHQPKIQEMSNKVNYRRHGGRNVPRHEIEFKGPKGRLHTKTGKKEEFFYQGSREFFEDLTRVCVG